MKTLRTTLFISYSHKDQEWLKRLRPHLDVLEHLGHVIPWDDRSIETGSEWYEEIKGKLQASRAAVLLISPDFLASKFCMKEEIPFMLEQVEESGLLLVPILLRPCAWKAVPWLKARQMTPGEGKTVSQHYKEPDQYDELFAEIAVFISEKLAEAPSPPPLPPPPAIPVDISRLPTSGRELFGRKDELAFLDEAWESATTTVVSLVAWGGVGKSALVNRWLEGLAKQG